MKMDFDRYVDELGPDYPECHVALIDALRNYIRCHREITRDLLDEGSITLEQAKADYPHMLACEALLAEIEDWNFDPSLCGVIQQRDRK